MAERFALDFFLRAGEVFHIARVNITSKQDLTYHCHDYSEMFWIECGEGVHHVNGHDVRIAAGDLYMIRPDDTHTFSSFGKGLTLVNIAFPKSTLAFLRERYFQTSSDFFWTESIVPFHTFLSKDILKRLSARAEDLMRQERNIIQQDSFLLFLFRQIVSKVHIEEFLDVPEWLANAIKIYNNPESFTKGVSYFVSLCNRNEDYVNRVVKRCLGKTLISLILEMKMRYAVSQLSMTSMPIKEICCKCGYRNLGYFYRVFNRIYGITPKQYRNINQKIV